MPKARGERLTGMLLAADRRQARIRSASSGLLRAFPELEQLIVKETNEAIDLRNGITIEITPARFAAFAAIRSSSASATK